jgi:hypothetical protein
VLEQQEQGADEILGRTEFFPGIPPVERRTTGTGDSFVRLRYPLSEATRPGAIALTLTPRGPSSLARFGVRPCSAYFETP